MLETSLTSQRKFEQFLFTVKALVYGLISFTVLGLIYRLLGVQFDVLDFSDGSRFLDRLDEIAWSVPVALLLGALSTANKTHRWVVRFLRWTHITDFSGTDDIWEFVQGMRGQIGEYVYVRDFENNLVYRGHVMAYSDDSEERELLLDDVSVFNLESEFMFNLDRIYLSFPKASARLEFPGEAMETVNG